MHFHRHSDQLFARCCYDSQTKPREAASTHIAIGSDQLDEELMQILVLHKIEAINVCTHVRVCVCETFCPSFIILSGLTTRSLRNFVFRPVVPKNPPHKLKWFSSH